MSLRDPECHRQTNTMGVTVTPGLGGKSSEIMPRSSSRFRYRFHVAKASNFIWTIMMLGSLAFELTASLLFTRKRLTWIGIGWGILFHISIALTMHNLIYFSIRIISFTFSSSPTVFSDASRIGFHNSVSEDKRVDLITTSAP